MTKPELIEKLYRRAASPVATKRLLEDVVDACFDEIAAALAREGRATWPGFGVFERVARAPRTGRHAVTGRPVRIPARTGVVFRPAGALLARMPPPTPPRAR